MKNTDDIQLLSIYNRYIIKENNQNYINPLKQWIESTRKPFKVNSALKNISEIFRINLNQDDPNSINKLVELLSSDKIKWNSSNNGEFILNNPPFTVVKTVIPITSLKESDKLELINTESPSDQHLNYQLSASYKTNPTTVAQLKLTFQDNNPIFSLKTNGQIDTQYSNYKKESTFLPKNVKAKQIINLFKGARTI